MVEIVGCSTPHPGQAVVPKRTYRQGKCPMCGPYHVRRTDQAGTPICPTCDMTAGEHAYRARILADSDAVFRQEWREWEAKRRRVT